MKLASHDILRLGARPDKDKLRTRWYNKKRPRPWQDSSATLTGSGSPPTGAHLQRPTRRSQRLKAKSNRWAWLPP